MKVVTISAMNIRAEQGRFFKLFQDVHRQLGKIRDKALYLKEAIEEETRGGVPEAGGEAEAGGFKPKAHRFEAAETAITDEQVEETSQALGTDQKETERLMKKISRARKKAVKA
jgi:Skp family chaperone for outer membrane proteins